MEYSKLLKGQKSKCKQLLDALLEKYEYASIFGTHYITDAIRMDRVNNNVQTREDAGYVVKVYSQGHYFEYSFDNMNQPVEAIVSRIEESTVLNEKVAATLKTIPLLKEEQMTEVFSRPNVGKDYSTSELKEELEGIKQEILKADSRVVNAMVSFVTRYNSSMFLSPNKDLEQFYTWTNINFMAFVKGEKGMKSYRGGANENSIELALKNAKKEISKTVETAVMLLDATQIEPGTYQVIVDPGVAGLIAHEAFGHGVEMDMFVKDRAKAKFYVEDYVASPKVSMKDGAASCVSAGSYFFDDDGMLAHDTTVIENGILKNGISDALSALELGKEPTGNGRRESYLRKAYARMTNTFFMPGTDKVEDMIASVKDGYLICGASNGMEDPKNWQIQCVASYGKEIKDGKFTGKVVAPVVISGYVPDLLKSIDMVSDEYHVYGSGMCGKGHKEWVFVSDGGPYMRAQVKLG